LKEVVKDAEAKASVEAEIKALTVELALTRELKAKAFAAEIRQHICRIFRKNAPGRGCSNPKISTPHPDTRTPKPENLNPRPSRRSSRLRPSIYLPFHPSIYLSIYLYI
jgi:hypothetical protein